MNRTSVAVAVVAVAALLTPGAIPSASAVSHAEAKHASVATTDGTGLAVHTRKVARLVGARRAALDRAARTVTDARLALGEAQILANIATDREAVAALGAAAARSTTLADVRVLRDQVRKLRPHVYTIVAHRLPRAARLLERAAANGALIDELAAQAESLELHGLDTAAVRAALDAATLDNNTAAAQADLAVDEGLLLTSFSSVWARVAFAENIAEARARLEVAVTHLRLAAEGLEAIRAGLQLVG